MATLPVWIRTRAVRVVRFATGISIGTLGTSWQHRLDASRTTWEIVDAGRDFLALFTPQEIQGLPERCRPPARLTDENIPTLALELVRREFEVPTAVDEPIHRMARFFTHAAMRLAQVTDREERSGDRQSA